MKNNKYRIFIIIAIIINLDILKAQEVGITDGTTFTPASLLHLNENSAVPVSVFQITNAGTTGEAITDGFLLKLEASFKVSFINQNLKTRKILFDDRTYENLKFNQRNETEPYYNILWGFNHLALGNLDSLNYYIKKSYKKCTKKEWLDQLQFWESSIVARKNRIAPETITIINKGLTVKHLYYDYKEEMDGI